MRRAAASVSHRTQVRRVPTLSLSIQGHTRFADLPARSTLARWIAAALTSEAQLTVRFVDAREGRRLNRDFRGKDYAPDVLTFAYATNPVVHADIVICVPVLRTKARALRVPARDHLAHLVVHATLHAHGHRHDRSAPAQAMEAREIEILRTLGKRNPYL